MLEPAFVLVLNSCLELVMAFVETLIEIFEDVAFAAAAVELTAAFVVVVVVALLAVKLVASSAVVVVVVDLRCSGSDSHFVVLA